MTIHYMFTARELTEVKVSPSALTSATRARAKISPLLSRVVRIMIRIAGAIRQGLFVVEAKPVAAANTVENRDAAALVKAFSYHPTPPVSKG